nr:hypothetical protein Iba_chr13aCG4980 [Ipomoea batatas]
MHLLIEQAESHVIVTLFLGFFLEKQINWNHIGRGSTTGSRSSNGNSATTATGADVHNEILNIPLLTELGEEARPVRLHGDISRLHKCSNLLRLNGDSIVVENQSSIGTGEFSDRHFRSSIYRYTNATRDFLLLA